MTNDTDPALAGDANAATPLAPDAAAAAPAAPVADVAAVIPPEVGAVYEGETVWEVRKDAGVVTLTLSGPGGRIVTL